MVRLLGFLSLFLFFLFSPNGSPYRQNTQGLSTGHLHLFFYVSQKGFREKTVQRRSIPTSCMFLVTYPLGSYMVSLSPYSLDYKRIRHFPFREAHVV